MNNYELMNCFVTDAVLSAVGAMKLVLKPALPARSSYLEGEELTCKRTLWWGGQDKWHKNYGSSEHRRSFFSEGMEDGVREGFVEELGREGYHWKEMRSRQVIKQNILHGTTDYDGKAPSMHPSVHLSIPPSTHYSIHLSVCASIHPSIHLFIYWIAVILSFTIAVHVSTDNFGGNIFRKEMRWNLCKV